jgi:hypothetical protein
MIRFALPALLLLAACATPPDRVVYVKPGTETLAASTAFATCEARANMGFPERRILQASPRVGVGIGVGSSGRVRGGLGTSIRFDRPDVNADGRAAALRGCLGSQGYVPVTLPGCQGPSQPLASQPFDYRGLCADENGQVAAPL